MSLTALLPLLLLPELAAQGMFRAAPPLPAACAPFRVAASAAPVEYAPYPRIGEPWAVQLSSASVVKEERTPIERVREALTEYLVVPREYWQRQYSHAGGLDESGWIVAADRCVQWTLRPGGLAWIVYPDGTAVYLTASIHDYTPIIQPSSHGSSIGGPALDLACVATLHDEGEAGLVERFRAMSPGERRACLAQLLQSITPEPGFTAEEFRGSLKRTPEGGYNLVPDPVIADRLSARVATNVAVARGIAELASAHLVDDPDVIRPLVECLNHPLLEVGKFCNRALRSLTRHTYGAEFFERSMNAPARTVQNRRRVFTDWSELNRLLAEGHPIFDEALASESLAAIQAIRAGLIEALRPLPQVAGYLATTTEPHAVAGDAERIYRFDVGSHNAANWPSAGNNISRIAILLFRPGVPRPGSDTQRDDAIAAFQAADYREVFPRLDLELRFAIGTSDETLRQAGVSAVREALAGLRAANARGSR